MTLGNNWKVISGKKEGQTQVCSSEFENVCTWSYPVDIHLATTGIPGNLSSYFVYFFTVRAVVEDFKVMSLCNHLNVLSVQL